MAFPLIFILGNVIVPPASPSFPPASSPRLALVLMFLTEKESYNGYKLLLLLSLDIIS